MILTEKKPVFNPLSEDKREEIGIRVFRFVEYNEKAPYENIKKKMNGLPSKDKEKNKAGNCLLRVISFMLVRHEENYHEIRQRDMHIFRGRHLSHGAVHGH